MNFFKSSGQFFLSNLMTSSNYEAINGINNALISQKFVKKKKIHNCF